MFSRTQKKLSHTSLLFFSEGRSSSFEVSISFSSVSASVGKLLSPLGDNCKGSQHGVKKKMHEEVFQSEKRTH